MKYLIDANNLAGKLKILKEPDFDKKLIFLLGVYFKNSRHKVILVFDTPDSMGDKYTEENFTIMYIPNDNFYNGADGKIIELLQPDAGEDLTLITDDVDIIMEAQKIKNQGRKNLKILKAFDFVKIINEKIDKPEKLSEDEISKLNQELLNKWL